MANATPNGIAPLPPPTVADLTKGPDLQPGFQYKPGLVVDNTTYGRVRTKVCSSDRREEKLDQMRRYYNENKDYMSAQEATYMQNQMSSLQNSIDPNEQSISAGPTAAQQAFNQQQAENWKDIEEMEDDPFYGAARGLGMSKDHAHAVSVLANIAGKGKAKSWDLQGKTTYKPPFGASSPYE